MISARRLFSTSSSYLAAFSTTSKATASSLTDLLTGSYDPLSKKKDDGQPRRSQPRTDSGQDQGYRQPSGAGQQARRQAVGTSDIFSCLPGRQCTQPVEDNAPAMPSRPVPTESSGIARRTAPAAPRWAAATEVSRTGSWSRPRSWRRPWAGIYAGDSRRCCGLGRHTGRR